MEWFFLCLLASSLFVSLLCMILWCFLKWKGNFLSAKTTSLLWFLLILSLLFPVKPQVKKPVFSLSLSEKEMDFEKIATYQHFDDTLIVTVSKEKLWETKIDLLSFCAFIWLFGMMISLFLLAVKNYFSYRLIKRWAFPVKEQKIHLALLQAQKEIGYFREIPLFTCPVISSPALMGIFHPVILLPEHLKKETTNEGLTLILAHELMHAKRFDLGKRLLALLVLSIYWFHPIIRLIINEFLLTCELACDEAILDKKEKEARAYYGMVLIRAAKQNKTPSFLSPLFSQANHLKRRVYACTNSLKKKKGISLVLVLSLLLLCSGLFFFPEKSQAINQNFLPISPTTGGSAPWYVKAYLNPEYLKKEQKTDPSLQAMRHTSSDILLTLVEESFTSHNRFVKEAKKRLSDALFLPKEAFYIWTEKSKD